MKINKISTTQQSMIIYYDDATMQRLRLNNVELTSLIRKHKLNFSLKDSTNNRKVYVSKVEAKNENDVKDDAAQMTNENDDSITEKTEIAITDLRKLGLKIAKSAYQKLKTLDSKQLELIVDYMKENDLKQVNLKVLNEIKKL